MTLGTCYHKKEDTSEKVIAMGLLTQIFVKPACISLHFNQDRLLLECFYDSSPIFYSNLAEKWPQVSEIRPFFQQKNAAKTEIPIEKLDQARQSLNKIKNLGIKKLKVNIGLTAQQMVVTGQAPVQFRVRYTRRGESLVRQLPEGTRQLQNGWFLLDTTCWKYTDLTPQDLACLLKEEIPFSQLPSFVRETLPALRRAGVAVSSEIEYSEIPAVKLEISDVQENSVTLTPLWHVQPENVDETVSWPGYVLAENGVHSGIAPKELRTVFHQLWQARQLTGEEIGAFLDICFDAWRPWLTGDIQKFQQLHFWAEAPFRWVLRVTPGSDGEALRPMAEPLACIGQASVSVDELTLAQQSRYWRFQSGWVRQKNLLQLGLNERGTLIGVVPACPFPLTARQLLHQGDQSMDILWSDMRIVGPEWCVQNDKHLCAAKHLSYLTAWGIAGGLTGGYEAFVAYGLPFLRQRLTQGECKTLILGRTEDIEALKQSGAGLAALTLLSYERVSRSAQASATHWDLLVLLEPDGYHSGYEWNQVITASRLSARQLLVFFAEPPSKADPKRMEQLASLLKDERTPEILRYVVRGCRDAVRLPEAYRFQHGLSVSKEEGRTTTPPAPLFPIHSEHAADITLPGTMPKGTAIPPKLQAGTSQKLNVSEPAGPAIPMVSREKAFLDEARKCADDEGNDAQPVPFSTYYPTYADMNARQRAWYFTLRTHWRKAVYPDADLSYLFVHVYELLQQVGTKDPADGYRQLLALWLGYRERYPNLDGLMAKWLGDYIHVYPCGVTDQQLMAEAPHLDFPEIDAVLSAMALKEPFQVPLNVLEQLSTYRVTASKFYQRGHQALMNQAIPGAAAWIDAKLRETNGKGLLDTYAPLKWHHERMVAFQGAPTAEHRTYDLHFRRYENGKRLQGYLRQVIRATENLLRAQCKFSARLQGIQLDDRSSAWLDAYVASLFPKQTTPELQEKAAPREKIILNLSELTQLREDSDTVRETLLATMGTAGPDAPETPLPAGTPDGLLTDLEPVKGLLARLGSASLRLLDFLKAQGWSADWKEIKARFPGMMLEAVTDEINQYAQDLLGCFLIEQENDRLVIAEDYRDELDYLGKKEPKTTGWTYDPEGLDEGWRSFFQTADLEALNAVRGGMETLTLFAKAHRQLPEVTLDALNSLAQDTIGDLIADEQGILEEYADLVNAHLRKE